MRRLHLIFRLELAQVVGVVERACGADPPPQVLAKDPEPEQQLIQQGILLLVVVEGAAAGEAGERKGEDQRGEAGAHQLRDLAQRIIG
ncbi:MAG: hypothetical protein ACK56I_21020, partial [bacterium]